MAKGKFRKDMRVREKSLQELRNEYCAKPTPNGTAAANSYKNNSEHSNYFDNLIDDLTQEAIEIGCKRSSGKRVILQANQCMFRIYNNRVYDNKGTKMSLYFNCDDLIEFSGNYEVIPRGKTVYFLSIESGYRIMNNGSTTYPYIGISKGETVEVLKKNGAIADKPYTLHELPRKDNTRVWWIEL